MRVVIDTNVIIWGILNPRGLPSRIVNALLSETITALQDDRMLSEYRDVLSRPTSGFFGGQMLEVLLDFVESAGEHVRALPIFSDHACEKVSRTWVLLLGGLRR